jgi:hypothetical protein
MVFFYFWLAIYFSTDKGASGRLTLPDSEALLRFDARAVCLIFVLYLVWDLLSHWMAHSHRYYLRKDNEPDAGPDELLRAKGYRTFITLSGLVASAAVLYVEECHQPAGSAATWWLLPLVAIVVLYRVLKDGVRDA